MGWQTGEGTAARARRASLRGRAAVHPLRLLWWQEQNYWRLHTLETDYLKRINFYRKTLKAQQLTCRCALKPGPWWIWAWDLHCNLHVASAPSREVVLFLSLKGISRLGERQTLFPVENMSLKSRTLLVHPRQTFSAISSASDGTGTTSLKPIWSCW